MRRMLLCGASYAALIGSISAQAQVPRSRAIEEIIVTAVKVRTNVQKTPIAIQTIPGKAILTAGVATAKDLQRLVPSMFIADTGGGGASFFIRGVGNLNESPTNDPGIAVSLDQMFFSRAYGPDLVFYDLDRVEVLKGPQGTLYGVNSTGGSVNIVTTKPDVDKISGYGRLELGNYAQMRWDGAANVPLSPTLAARVAFQTNNHSGYMSDGYNDADSKAGRVHLLWKPTSDFSLLLSGEAAHDGGRGIEGVPFVNNAFVSSDPYQGAASPFIMNYVASQAGANGNVGPVPFYRADPRSCFPGCLPPQFNNAPPGPFQTQTNGYIDTSIVSFRADLEWNLGFANLSVVPTLLNTNYNTSFYGGPEATYNKGSAHQQSFELRLASPQDQKLTWITGLFARHERQDFFYLSQSDGFNEFIQFNDPKLDTNNGGVFAQTSYKIIPSLTLTAGIRYSVENKVGTNDVTSTAVYPFAPPFISPTYALTPTTKQHDEAPTFRAGLDWQVTPDNLLYFNFSTGFHSGGLEPGAPATRPLCTPNPSDPPPVLQQDFRNCDTPSTYAPEKLKAYAIGSKNRLFGNRMQLNLEAYEWDYNNLQANTLGIVNPGITGLRTENAGNSVIRGVDADMRIALSPDDLVNANVNFNHSAYGQFVSYVVFPFAAFTTQLTGEPFLNAPAFVANVTYAHNFDFAGGGSLTPSANVAYRSKIVYIYDTRNNPVEQNANFKVDLNLDYLSPHGRYEVQLFVRNLADKATILSNQGLQSVYPGAAVSVAPPRTYGGSLTVRF